MSSRQIIIGDVHGCIDELKELLGGLKPTAGDRLIFTGDLINKGPNSSAVVDFVQTIARDTCEVTLLLGNHEEKFLRWLKHETSDRQRGTPNPMAPASPAMAKLAAELREDQIETLQSSLLWVSVPRSADERPVVVVHAGIGPNLKELKESDRTPAELPRTRWRELEDLVRIRFVNQQGTRVRLGGEQPTDRYWAEIYDGRFGRVIYGHEPSLTGELRVSPNALGIDLGCVYGGHLAAVVFEADRPGWTSRLVKARRQYAAMNRRLEF